MGAASLYLSFHHPPDTIRYPLSFHSLLVAIHFYFFPTSHELTSPPPALRATSAGGGQDPDMSFLLPSTIHYKPSTVFAMSHELFPGIRTLLSCPKSPVGHPCFYSSWIPARKMRE